MRPIRSVLLLPRNGAALQAARHRQISPCAGLGGGKAQGLARPQPETLLHRLADGAHPEARHAHHHVAQGRQDRAFEGQFQERRVRRVADQPIGKAGRAGIQRAAAGQPDLRLMRAASVHQQIQQAGLLYPEGGKAGVGGPGPSHGGQRRRLALPRA